MLLSNAAKFIYKLKKNLGKNMKNVLKNGCFIRTSASVKHLYVRQSIHSCLHFYLKIFRIDFDNGPYRIDSAIFLFGALS